MSKLTETFGCKFLGVFALVIAVTSACSDDKKKEVPLPTVVVDTTLQPLHATVPGIDGGAARTVAAATGPGSPAADFVAEEMVVGTDDPAKLEAVRARWSGTVLKTIDFGAAGVVGGKNYYLLRIDASHADPSRIPDDMRELDANAHGEHQVSSDAAVHLLAAVAEERMRGEVEVAANWVADAATFQTRSALDSPAGFGGAAAAWTPDIYQQPGFRSGDAQDIGVGEAWRAMEAAGKFSNKVKIVIADGGFHPNADVPISTDIRPPNGWDRPNPSTCTGGSTCNWHGTGVAQIAFGALDNGFAAAGVAAPVANPTLVPMPAGDFFQILGFVVSGLPALVGSHQVVNISAGTGIGAGWYILTFGALDGIAALLRLNNTLIVAAAGNDGQDVDDIDCADFLGARLGCWEGTVWVPCELPGVICVGGLGFDSSDADNGSNFHGADDGSGSVDIHAPYWNWVGPDPDDAASGPNSARLIAGTSGASPFVAGVAALVWASKPSLSANEVDEILMRTAHADTGRVMRRVNAYAAVRDALGGNTAPFAQILSPTSGSTFARHRASVPLMLNLEDDSPGMVNVSWTSNFDGTIGSGSSTATTSLSAGVHTITATITDTGNGVVQTRTTTVTIFDEAPSIEIVQPRVSGLNVYQQQTVHLAVRSFDFGEGAALPDSAVSWHIGSAVGASAGPNGNTLDYHIGADQTSPLVLVAVATSSAGLGANDSVSYLVNPEPDNFPPDVVITLPEANSPTFDGSAPVSVSFEGLATDFEDGAITGTSLVWAKRAINGCGGACPGGFTQIGTGNAITHGFAVLDCFGTTYEVRLQATDSGTDTAAPAASEYITTITVTAGPC